MTNDIQSDALTEDGTTAFAKNEHRIHEIDARMSVSRDVSVYSSAMAKIIRKDWNIVCAKMYVFSLDRKLEPKISEALNDLHWQVSDLMEGASVSLFKTLDTAWLTENKFPDLRIVSPSAASWLRAILNIDRCLALMLTAEREGQLTKEQRMRSLSGVNFAYTNFKFVAMNKSIPRKAEVQAEDIFA